MNRYKTIKTCDVCGDKTFCRNFTANACESCKAFFRRAIIQTKTFVCPSDGQCIINKLTRATCKVCRLNKCLIIGMKKEFIQSNVENNKRRQSIKTNGFKPKFNGNESTNSELSVTSDESIQSPLTDDKDFLNDLINNSLNIDDKVLENQIIEIENNLLTNDGTVNEVVATKTRVRELAIGPVFKVITDYESWNQLETNRFQELFNATKAFEYPMISNKKFEINTFKQMIQICEHSMEDRIKDVIKFTKRINGFTKTCADDQWTLVKSGCLELIMLKHTTSYNSKFDYVEFTTDPQTTLLVKMDIFKIPAIKNYYTKYREYLNKQLLDFTQDSIINNLLTAIILFNPNRSNLKHRHQVKLEQQLYIYLLQRYLKLKYRFEWELQSNLTKLLNSCRDLTQLTEMQLTYARDDEFKECLPYCGPLVREIYDIV